MKTRNFRVAKRPAGIEPAVTIYAGGPAHGEAIFVEVGYEFASPHQAGELLGRALYLLAGAFAAGRPDKETEDALALIESGIADALKRIRARESANPTREH